jgi:hypothetical protein
MVLSVQGKQQNIAQCLGLIGRLGRSQAPFLLVASEGGIGKSELEFHLWSFHGQSSRFKQGPARPTDKT